jgi:hypothetical protein
MKASKVPLSKWVKKILDPDKRRVSFLPNKALRMGFAGF